MGLASGSVTLTAKRAVAPCAGSGVNVLVAGLCSDTPAASSFRTIFSAS